MKGNKREWHSPFRWRRNSSKKSSVGASKDTQHNIVPKLVGVSAGDVTLSESESELDSDTASSATPKASGNTKNKEKTLERVPSVQMLRKHASMPINKLPHRRSALFNQHKHTLTAAPLSKGELEWFQKVFESYIEEKSERIIHSSQKTRLMKRLFELEWPQLIVLFLEWKMVVVPNNSAFNNTQQPFRDYFLHEYRYPREHIDQLMTIFFIGLQVELTSIVRKEDVQTLFRDSWAVQLIPRIHTLTLKFDINLHIDHCLNRIEDGWPYYYNLSKSFPKFFEDTQLTALKKLMINLCDEITKDLPSPELRSAIVTLYVLLKHHAPRILELESAPNNDDVEISEEVCHRFALEKTLSVLWLRLYGPMFYPGLAKREDPEINEVMLFISNQFNAAINHRTKADILLKIGKAENENLDHWYDYMDKVLSPYLRSKLFDFITRCIQTCKPAKLLTPHTQGSIFWPSAKVRMPKITLLDPPLTDETEIQRPALKLKRRDSTFGKSLMKRVDSRDARSLRKTMF